MDTSLWQATVRTAMRFIVLAMILAAVPALLWRILIVCCGALLFAGSGINSDQDALIAQATVDPPALVLAARELVDARETDNAGSFSPEDYPPVIARLQPQFVALDPDDAVRIVNIQLSGGFQHAGVLVVLDPVPEGFVPPHEWTRREPIHPGIYVYRE